MTLPTLSLVVPAYNEEKTIGFLLDSIREQQDHFEQIIVVDNNSTDQTAVILELLRADFANLDVVQEKAPGVIEARNAGFDLATGDIIVRLDADTRAHPDWALNIREYFAAADESVGAATGLFDQYDMPMPWLHKALLDVGLRGKGADVIDVDALFGANMAIRRTLWESIRPNLMNRSGIFDDLDISLCVREAGSTCVLIPGMEISASGRRLLSSVKDYRTFTSYLPATFEARGMHEAARQSWGAVWTMRALHLALYIPVRAWDAQERKYSLNRLRTPAEQRPLPYPADTTRPTALPVP